MEKKLFRTTCSTELWFAIFISFAITWIFLCFDYSTFHSSNNGVLASSLNPNRLLVKHSAAARSVDLESDTADPCSGRYLFIQDIPSRFNSDLIRNCQSLTRGTDKSNMCPYLVNFGLGPEIEDSQGVFSNNSWFKTNQFLLEVIFHNKMKQYKCLTNDSAMAAAVYVPFYAGLDISHYLWNPSISVRDSSARDFLSVISEKPEWKRMFGRDHFFIAGRISWDFRRKTDDVSDWGSKLRFLPESHNMTMLSVEASSWKNDFAIPYPTYFHPLKLSEVVEWQSLMRTKRRRHLFTFAGAPRPELRDSIRGMVIEQCRGSSLCKFIDCSSDGVNCDDPVTTMKEFQSSIFCLQPVGDSYTRRSTFDSILAGCIPVFFHPGSAYSQYLWHFPENKTAYSVYIPVRDVKNWNESIEGILNGIPKDRESAMREEVIRTIPRIVYADPRSKFRDFEDAFDLAVKGILERVEDVRRKIRDGKDPSEGFDDPDHFKYTFSRKI
ncbi:probable xyloglucan galactosyltransferase GT14 [Cucurbita moschata]|uniref:Probable xyloglucan galactosyltransferase GT14 n=1 Tax=Cucurbita moschata TaxID=3662 RepID=A0A6J1HL56_CUCMO|nr:probable xyloglucan galactosyltransferase GT14 [Cucurbita moschata]